MRTLFILALGLGCAFMAGWFTINREGGETTIKINRDEIKSDAKSALAKGQEYLRRRDGGSQPQPQPQQGQPYGGQPAQAPWNNQQQNYQQQYTAGPSNQQYPPQQPQYQGQPGQQPYQGQQGGFYYPPQQHANRPAPWETQQNLPAQQPQGRQF